MSTSGATDCRCRDCLNVAMSNDVNKPDFCNDCEEAGCQDDSACEAEYEAIDFYDHDDPPSDQSVNDKS